MGAGHKGKRLATAGAFVAAGLMALVAALAPKEAIPEFLQFLTSGWGWLITCVMLLIGAVLTYLSFQEPQESPPGLPIYEETFTDSVGLIRHVTINDSLVAITYVESRYQIKEQESGDNDG